MTIILSVVIADYALQVSDRLLTIKEATKHSSWDPESNKSVILLARDGLVDLAYSGQAHIAGARTDGWIAEVLSGQDLGANLSRPKFGLRVGGAGPDRFLAAHLAAVAEGLNHAEKAGDLTGKVAIDYVGFRWQNPNDLAWPVFGRITRDPTAGGYRMVMSKKRWGWESGRRYLFRATGFSEKPAQTLLRNRLAKVDVQSKEAVAATLIDILRSLPPDDPTVGRDCLVTTIQRSSPHVNIKFAPYDFGQISVVFTGRTVNVSAGYTPWIVAPELLAAPQVIAGMGSTGHCRGFDFMVEGPDPEGDLTIMSSQVRRQWRR
jgi:hypothetical protein